MGFCRPLLIVLVLVSLQIGYITYLQDTALCSVALCSLGGGNKSRNMSTSYQAPKLHVGVFMQVANPSIWPDMFVCLANVVEAQLGVNKVGVHISFPAGFMKEPQRLMIETSVRGLSPELVPHVAVVENAGADIGQFLEQIVVAEREGIRYDVLLKIHSKTSDRWRNLMLDPLCGSVSQVHSVMNNFIQRPDVHMLAAVGTVFYIGSSVTEVAPIIAETCAEHWRIRPTDTAAIVPEQLFSGCVDKIEQLASKISPDIGLRYSSHEEWLSQNWTIVAGSMFWVRHEALRPARWADHAQSISQRLTRGYALDFGLEHCIERFLPTLVQNSGGKLAILPSAPKAFLVNYLGTRRPVLNAQKEDLGSYDVMTHKSRKDYSRVARMHGVHGFMFYYHGLGDRSLSILDNGGPDLPFVLTWSNMLASGYGELADWTAHAEYLVTFFKHEKYLKTWNRPVLGIDRPGHIHTKLKPMMQEMYAVAVRHGFAGLYFMNSVGNFYDEEMQLVEQDLFPAAFHFMPTIKKRPGTNRESMHELNISSVADLDWVREPRQYWGASTGFGILPRKADPADQKVNATEFGRALSKSFAAMPYKVKTENDGMDNLFLVASWDQSGNQLGAHYLQALRNALQNVTAREVTSASLKPSSTTTTTTYIDPRSMEYAMLIGAIEERREYYSNQIWSESFSGVLRFTAVLPHKSVSGSSVVIDGLRRIQRFELFLWKENQNQPTIDEVKAQVSMATGVPSAMFSIHVMIDVTAKNGEKAVGIGRKLHPMSVALDEYKKLIRECPVSMCRKWEELNGKYVVDVIIRPK